MPREPEWYLAGGVVGTGLPVMDLGELLPDGEPAGSS